MKILLDENLPKKLKFDFSKDHEVHTAQEMGWNGKKNGELLALVAENEFDILITMDKKLRYQQNLDNISFSIFILDAPDNRITTLTPYAEKITVLLEDEMKAGINEIKI